MKYTEEILIDLPLERVIALFDNADNLAKWQPGLVSFEHQSGTPGQSGAKSKLVYQMGKRRIEMIETITENRLPEAFNGTYEAKNVMNWVNNSFKAIGPNQTRWTSENEFKFGGFMKIIGFLMPKAFPKETCKYMKQFKEFAEAETA